MPTKSTDTMATEILRLQEELAAKNAETDARRVKARKTSHRMSFLEAMMETVPVGVVMADAEGRIIYGNSHVEKMVRHPVLLDSQGSLRRFPLSQFHQFFPEGFSRRFPSQALSGGAVQAVTNRLHISI